MYSDFDREVGEMRVEQERRRASMPPRRAEEARREQCECGATISPARRRVYPSATRCLECQEIVEKEAYLK